MSETLRALVAAARARFVTAGIDANEAALDAALLARHLLGWDLARLVAHETDPCPAGFPAGYDTLVARRASREPMSIILGRREFWGLDFEVTPAVLAPRPETELILDITLERCGTSPRTPRTVVDVGTGSGCLAIGLARELPGARVIATDISAASLEVAARNAARHGVDGRIAFVRTSLLRGLSGPVELIVSNPPYVPAGDIPLLPPEVRDWEPHTALDGGADGLDIIRGLLDEAARVLTPGGWLIMEFGFGQEDGVREATSCSALELVDVRRDLQGVPRTLVAQAGPRATSH